MPSKVKDHFSKNVFSRECFDDLAATLDGRKLIVFTESDFWAPPWSPDRYSVRLFDIEKETFSVIESSELLFGEREQIFTFVLSRTTVVILAQVYSKGTALLALFKSELGEMKPRLSRGKLVAQAVPLHLFTRIIACQWGTEIFLILSSEFNSCVQFHRFRPDKMSKTSKSMRIPPGNLKDSVAYEDRLYTFRGEGKGWIDPKSILVTEFEKDYRSEWIPVQPDMIRGFPKGTDFAMDIWNGAIWSYTEPSSEKYETNNSSGLWKLDLETLAWSHISLKLPHYIQQPIIHCLPTGRMFLMGYCPNEYNLIAATRCPSPTHLYSCWLDVPKLSLLAQRALPNSRLGWQKSGD